MTLFVVAIALLLGGGTLALLFSRAPRVASACAVAGAVGGGVAGLTAALSALLHGGGGSLEAPWSVPHGAIRLALDPLSAFFLVPVFGLGAIAAVYGREYLASAAKRKPIGFTWFAFDVLLASMAVVVVARQAVLFLVAWELMSLASWVLVTFDHEREEVRRAGFVYLVATHIGTAFLVAMFLLLARSAGSFDFDAIRAAGIAAPAPSSLLLAFGLVGFGVKAGFFPLHVWLPEAHAAAPSHVSAVMSGVLVKVGLYGVLRTVLLVGRPAPWLGPLLVVLGIASAFVGIALALQQRDVKRLLAYSTVENMGLVALGVGVALWGWSAGRPAVAVLGATGALLHVWNHTLMKGLMFLGAGSVLHGAKTKDLERLGGLMKRMPWTATTMTVGAIAIAGLPPLNGFVSEWLLYMGLVQTALASGGATAAATLLAVGVVAFVGALAMLCFVRLVGIALLGAPRSEDAAHAHESRASMTGPLVVLAALSIAAAVLPTTLARAASSAVDAFLGPSAGAAAAAARTADAAPLAEIGTLHLALWALLAIGAVGWALLRRARPSAEGPTWDCGYARPTARMQYTGRSFAELMAERILPKRLRPRVAVVSPAALFPQAGSLSTESPDPLTRDVYEPLVVRLADRFVRLRWLQQGKLHVYVLYILVGVVAALGWLSIDAWAGR